MKNTGKYNVYHGVVAVGRWVLFAVVAFLILFPVYWIFISSITPSGELFKTPIDYLPDHPTLESYKFLIQNVGLLSKIGNTVLIVGLTLVISTVSVNRSFSTAHGNKQYRPEAHHRDSNLPDKRKPGFYLHAGFPV